MSSSSAETVANIEELLKQILVRVPALSLLRFKSVSKHWLSLISDPDFHRRHTLRNLKISAFFDESFNSIPLVEIPQGWNPFKFLTNSVSNLRILQSCNGLFLCHIPYKFSKNRKLYPVYVVNPTTNRFRALSPPRVKASEEILRNGFVRYGLAYDPFKSPHYKVVCVNDYDGGRHEIEMYSSETEEWKHLDDAPFFCSPGIRRDVKQRPMEFDYRSMEGAVYCDGAVHWMRKRMYGGLEWGSIRIGDGPWSRDDWLRDDCDVLHYFDFGDEQLRLAPVTPPVPLVVKNISLEDGNWPCLAGRYFGECGGRLCLIETFEHCNTQLEVMEMEKDYSGWIVKYNVDLNPLVAALPRQDWSAFVILGLSQQDETDFEVQDTPTDLLLHLPGQVISYNIVNKTFKTSVHEELLLVLGVGHNPRNGEDVLFPYMETLACL